MEYEVRNNQRIDVVAGLDKEVEVAVEVEFSSPDYYNDLQKLQSLQVQGLKLRVIVSDKPIGSNIPPPDIEAVLIPSEANRDFENLLRSKFPHLDSQYYPYPAVSSSSVSPSVQRILEDPKIDVPRLKNIIYRRAIKEGGQLPQDLAKSRECKVDEALELDEEFYLYSYMEKFGDMTDDGKGHLRTPFGIVMPDYMGDSYSAYKTMKGNIQTIKSIVSELLHSKAEDIKRYIDGINNNLLQILLYGSNGRVQVPEFSAFFKPVKFSILNNLYTELVYYGGNHPSAQRGFSPKYLRLMPLLSIPIHEKFRNYYDEIRRFLDSLTDIDMAFKDFNYYRFPSLDIADVFGVKLKIDKDSREVEEYVSWWVILNYRDGAIKVNNIWANSDLEVICRNLGINIETVVTNIRELANQDLITPPMMKDGPVPSYKIYEDDDFFSYIIERMAGIYARIV